MTADVRPLGWGRFVLQLVTTLLVYVIASVPPVLVWGMDSSLGLALSTVTSMAAGLFIAWPWLRSDRAVGIAWNFTRPQSWPRTIGIAVAATVAIVLWFQFGAWATSALGMPKMHADAVLKHVTASPADFALWVIAVGWFAAGLGEEMLFRGFLLDRFMRLRGFAGRAWLAVLAQAAIFGLPHIYEGGASGIVVTGAIGVFFGWLRLKQHGNLWALVLAHAAVDTAMMAVAYAGKLGWVSF